MEPTVNRYLLFDHFAGKSTPMQKRLIEEWLHTPKNKETFYEWLVEWEHQSPQYLPELDEKVQSYIYFMKHNRVQAPDYPEPAYEKIHTYRKAVWIRWLVAASMLLASLSLGWINRNVLTYKTYQTGYNQTKILQLSDGTRIAMNSNTSLRVPRFGFGANNREVHLTGEANFSVTHTFDNKPFIVKSEQNLEVVVLGTEFTFYSRKRGSKIVLHKGKVKLRYQEGLTNKEVMMAPGDLVILDQQGHATIGKTEHPQNFASWKDQRFVFENTSLPELTYLFEENFGLVLKIEGEELKKLSLYGSFQAQSAEELLKALTEAANLSYKKQNDTITISPAEY